MANYSNRSLRDKLGLKTGMRAALVRVTEPVRAEFGDLDDIKPLKQVTGVPFDFILAAISSREQLEAVLPNLKSHLRTDGTLWLAWTKRTSPLHHGLDENMIRRHGLDIGLVDVKVAAIDNDWSGLKFVYRVKDR
jgi:hypothetical protein